jgi:hypothetical protein
VAREYVFVGGHVLAHFLGPYWLLGVAVRDGVAACSGVTLKVSI